MTPEPIFLILIMPTFSLLACQLGGLQHRSIFLGVVYLGWEQMAVFLILRLLLQKTPPTQQLYEWRQAVGDAILQQGFVHFKQLYNQSKSLQGIPFQYNPAKQDNEANKDKDNEAKQATVSQLKINQSTINKQAIHEPNSNQHETLLTQPQQKSVLSVNNNLYQAGWSTFGYRFKHMPTNPKAFAWDMVQLKREQAIAQPLHQQYLTQPATFVNIAKSLTGVNLLKQQARMNFGCKLMGYTDHDC